MECRRQRCAGRHFKHGIIVENQDPILNRRPVAGEMNGAAQERGAESDIVDPAPVDDVNLRVRRLDDTSVRANDQSTVHPQIAIDEQPAGNADWH